MNRLLLIFSLLLFFNINSANATPLNLNLNQPLISSLDISISYDANSDNFFANGIAGLFKSNNLLDIIVSGSFNLSANINSSGVLFGGTLDITGTAPPLGFNSGTLLTGTLNSFGFGTTAATPFEFLFDVTGGDAANLYGSSGGIILTNTGFPGDFSADFSNQNDGFSVSDVGSVGTNGIPEPTTLALLGLGLTGISFKNWRKKKAV